MVDIIDMEEDLVIITDGEVEWAGKKVKTSSGRIIPFPKGVDPLLLKLICVATAVDPRDRPSLTFLFEFARRQVARPPRSYRNRPEEQDAAVSQLWRDIIYNAPAN